MIALADLLRDVSGQLGAHGYGFALEWSRLVPLMAGMQELTPELRRQLDAFAAALAALADRLE